MSFTFYAQQGEDIYTVFNFINKPASDGIFVEIGGFDGLTYSNTKFFENVFGFKGVLIEPTEHYYKMKANRPTCDCYKFAVAKTKSKVKFLGKHATAGLVDTMADSFKNSWHKEATEYEVDAEPFSNILACSNIKYIDFMTIDVEGGEQIVLETFDFNIPVYVIAIELDNHNPEKDEKCREILRANGFTFDRRITSNEFWINKTYFRKDELYNSSVPKPEFTSVYELGRFPFLEKHLIADVEEALKS
jgi:FkbM family methyltransferase